MGVHRAWLKIYAKLSLACLHDSTTKPDFGDIQTARKTLVAPRYIKVSEKTPAGENECEHGPSSPYIYHSLFKRGSLFGSTPDP
jgi:hypothetical protein